MIIDWEKQGVPCDISEVSLEDGAGILQVKPPILIRVQFNTNWLQATIPIMQANKRLNRLGYYFHPELNSDLLGDQWRMIANDVILNNPGA